MTVAEKNQSHYARLVLVGIDQLISATSNFMVVWTCLTSLPTEAFGSFSYSWSTIALFVVLSRALFGIPALLDSEILDSKQAANTSSALTGTLIFGFITALITLILYLLSGTSESEIWIFGLFLLAPLILFQDQIRYLIIATKRIYFAIFLDLLVLGCIMVTVVVAMNSGFVGWNLIFGLASGYLLASLLFVYRVPIDFNLCHLRLFIKLDYHRRSRLVSDAFLAWGFGLVAMTLIRVAVGDSGIAIYNGLVFLFGPVTLVTVFLTLGLQSEVVRTKGDLAFRHKASLAAISLSPILWVLIIISAPERFAEGLLGQSMSVILTNSIVFALSSLTFLILEILNLFMRAHQKFEQLVALRLGAGVTLLLLILCCIFLDLEFVAIIWSFVISNIFAVIGTAAILRRT